MAVYHHDLQLWERKAGLDKFGKESNPCLGFERLDASGQQEKVVVKKVQCIIVV